MADTVQNAEGHQAIVGLGISSRIFFVTCTVRSAAHVCPVVVTNRHTYGCCRSVSEVVAFPAFISRWSTRRHVAKLRGAHQHGKGLLKSKGHTRVYCLPEACCARAGAKHDTRPPMRTRAASTSTRVSRPLACKSIRATRPTSGVKHAQLAVHAPRQLAPVCRFDHRRRERSPTSASMQRP
jgi:hypothetical protein